MFKLRNVKIHFKFDACYRPQNSWDGACLLWCSISSSFQNSSKMSGHRGYELWLWVFRVLVLEFCPILAWYWFPAAEEFVAIYFLFNDAKNVLYMWKTWTAGRPIQHTDSSTTKPCCCNSCIIWFCIVLMKYTRPSLKYTSSGGEHMLL